MNRPSLYSIDIWTQWEHGILQIMTEALSQLDSYVDTDDTENDITVELHKIILRVRFNCQRVTFGNIMLQTQNQPLNAVGEQENQAALRKKPDLQWVFNDENASTPEKSQRFFTIECKCLSTSAEEQNYVEKGISRFTLDEWGYGRNEKSGMMVAYVKDMDMDKHLNQINKHNERYTYPLLIVCSSVNEDVHRYVQKFETREFEPKRFKLHHLWISVSKKWDISK